MGIRTGAAYLAGLRDGREVWLEGERVQDVAAHPRLARTVHTIAALYDLQHDPDLHEQMTFPERDLALTHTFGHPRSTVAPPSATSRTPTSPSAWSIQPPRA